MSEVILESILNQAKVSKAGEEYVIPNLNSRATAELRNRRLVTLQLSGENSFPALIRTQHSNGEYSTTPVEDLPQTVTGVFDGFTEVTSNIEGAEDDKEVDIAMKLTDPSFATTSNLIPVSGIKKILDSLRVADSSTTGRDLLDGIIGGNATLIEIAQMVEKLPTDPMNNELFNAIIQFLVRPSEIASSVSCPVFFDFGSSGFEIRTIESDDELDSLVETDEEGNTWGKYSLIFGTHSIIDSDIFSIISPGDANFIFKDEDTETIGKLVLCIYPTDDFEVQHNGLFAALESDRFLGYERTFLAA